MDSYAKSLSCSYVKELFKKQLCDLSIGEKSEILKKNLPSKVTNINKFGFYVSMFIKNYYIKKL